MNLKSKLAKNSVVYTIDFAMQIIVQAIYLLLLSRALGPTNYGLFVSISAISIIGSMFVGWGSEHVLIKKIAVNPATYRQCLGQALLAIVMTLPILFAICTAFSLYIDQTHQTSIYALIMILIADLLFSRILSLSKSCFTAFENSKTLLHINIAAAVIKLLAAGIAVIIHSPITLDVWAIWYCGSVALGSIYAASLVGLKLGWPTWPNSRFDYNLGSLFCGEFASLAAMRDIDKPIVVSVLGAEAGGYYAVAFRIADAASAPVRGLLYATYTRFFRHADEGACNGLKFGMRILPYGLAISALVGVLIYCLSWTIPFLLGTRYAPAVDLLKLFAIYPLLLGLMGIGADILRSVGYQNIRVFIITVAAILTGIVCHYAAGIYGITGATISRLVVQSILVLLTWWLIARFNSKVFTATA